MKDFSKNIVVFKQVENPTCEVEGCSHTAQWTGRYRKDGSKIYRRRSGVGYMCAQHHNQQVAKNRGLSSIAEVIAKNAGFNTVSEHLNDRALQKGFENHTEYSNSLHPYRKHRKDYCENIDSRLGYECTTTIVHSCQLDTDHKDGNHLNNDPNNLQTLCKCCHSYKGLIYEDHKSPGRKTRKVI